MIDVSHYGLHRADGNIAFLMQAETVSNALGLPLSCPFQVVPTSRWVQCNHRINLLPFSHTPFMDDPVVRAMRPIPQAAPAPVFIAGGIEMKKVLSILAGMSAYIKPPIVPLWATNLKRIRYELQATNVQPLVITDLKPTDRKDVDAILEMATLHPRQLILLGSDDMFFGSKVLRLKTNLTHDDLTPYNWAEIGAQVLKEEMLRHVA